MALRLKLVEDFYLDAASLSLMYRWQAATGMWPSGVEANSSLKPMAPQWSADKVFTREASATFLDELRRWARVNLNVGHASTPSILIVQKTTQRTFRNDKSAVEWIYIYVLSQSPEDYDAALNVIFARRTILGRIWPLTKVFRIRLKRNLLIAIPVDSQYELVSSVLSYDPITSLAIMIGYLW